jgi:hypothetical protein
MASRFQTKRSWTVLTIGIRVRFILRVRKSLIQSYKTKCLRIYDYSLFTGFAQTLAKWFGHVEYYSPWKSEFPKNMDRYIGKGLPGVTRIDDFFSGMDDVDLFAFFDVLDGDLQVDLATRGDETLRLLKSLGLQIPSDIEAKAKALLNKRVFGGRFGENLELYRDWGKKKAKKLGIEVGPYDVVQGMEKLREYLKENPGTWVKIDICRGDMETWFSETLQLSNDRLVQLEADLGSAIAQDVEFILEKPIPCGEGEEGGSDSLSIDGQYPDDMFFGSEIKGKSFAGCVVKYKKMPEDLRTINDKLAPFLKAKKYRMFFSTEERKGKLTDPCMRLPSPPNELYQKMIGNLPDVMWFGAEGKLIQPEYIAKRGGLVRIRSDWINEKKTQAISWPKEYDENIVLRKHCRIGGHYFVLPKGPPAKTVGSIVAWGDDFDEIWNRIREVAKHVKGHDLEIMIDETEKAEEGLKKLLKEHN